MADKMIIVSSGFGVNTRLPFVQIESEELDTPIQVSPQEARNLAMNLLQASEAADTDAFMVGFMRWTAQLNDQQIGEFLMQFRNERKKYRNG